MAPAFAQIGNGVAGVRLLVTAHHEAGNGGDIAEACPPPSLTVAVGPPFDRQGEGRLRVGWGKHVTRCLDGKSGSIDGQPCHLPFWKSIFQPPRPVAALA